MALQFEVAEWHIEITWEALYLSPREVNPGNDDLTNVDPTWRHASFAGLLRTRIQQYRAIAFARIGKRFRRAVPDSMPNRGFKVELPARRLAR